MSISNEQKEVEIPLVEIFESVQGEGTKAGYVTTFIRLFGCNLRCAWCDTTYSYPPEKPQLHATVNEIIKEVKKYNNRYICITGGEPLLREDTMIDLIESLICIEEIEDIHIETNGSIDLKPFIKKREINADMNKKVRFIVDYKLDSSGEKHKMLLSNYPLLSDRDEIKFVVSEEAEFNMAKEIISCNYCKGTILFSPVSNKIKSDKLAKLLIDSKLKNAKLNLQLHKVIWSPEVRGV